MFLFCVVHIIFKHERKKTTQRIKTKLHYSNLVLVFKAPSSLQGLQYVLQAPSWRDYIMDTRGMKQDNMRGGGEM